MPLLPSIALLLGVLGGGAAGSPPGAALAAPAAAPLPSGLVLPRDAFPRGSAVRGTVAPNRVARGAFDLHSQSPAALGRISGVLQTASWTATRRRVTIAVRYLASTYPTPALAAAALDDARITLWESGRLATLPGVADGVFVAPERGIGATVFATAARGPVEIELRLRLPTGLDAVSRRAARARAGAVMAEAIRLAEGATAGLPPVPASAPAGIAVAPAGVGPIVKSPSRMALGTVTPAVTTDSLPGGFRANPAPLAGRATLPTLAIAGQPVSRYAETARGAAGTLYDSTALFTSPAAASRATAALAAGMAGRQARRADLGPWRSGLPYLAAAAGARAWQAGRETIVVLRSANVVQVLAGDGGLLPLAPLADRLLSTVPSWLSASGIQTVDAAGRPVHLDGLNWYGAEESDFVVGGLDYAPYTAILDAISARGFNSVRIPFSNQMVEQNPVVTLHLAANPSLRGLRALDILDRIVQYAGAVGLSVILDNHRSAAGWSSQPNGLWYDGTYSDAAFVADWRALAARYARTNVVVAADLRNEPHGPATWGTGDPATDWRLAAQRAGNAALAANPRLLIMVEGVQYANGISYWWGGNLMGVATAPIDLRYPDASSARDRLIYSVHDYGPNNCGGGCPWFNATTSYESLAAVWERFWGYILDDPSAPYAAPIWIGEFGTCNQSVQCVSDTLPGSQGQWFASLVRYIGARHLGWSYWPANGTMSTGGARVYGTQELYGYFTQDWGAPVPWLDAALAPIRTDAAPSNDTAGR